MSVPAVQQLFDSELSHFRSTIEVAKDYASEGNLQNMCQASRTVFAVLEQWVLIDGVLNEGCRKQALAAHEEACEILSGRIPSASEYIRDAVGKRLEKISGMSVKSLRRELKTILDSIEACSAP